MRRLRLGEVKELAQGHVSSKLRNVEPYPSDPKPIYFVTLLNFHESICDPLGWTTSCNSLFYLCPSENSWVLGSGQLSLKYYTDKKIIHILKINFNIKLI